MDTSKLLFLMHATASVQIGAAGMYIEQNWGKVDPVALIIIGVLSSSLAAYAGVKLYQGPSDPPEKMA